jgi:hypothetical protein
MECCIWTWTVAFPPSYLRNHIAMIIFGKEALINALFSSWNSFLYFQSNRDIKGDECLDRKKVDDSMPFKYYDSPPRGPHLAVYLRKYGTLSLKLIIEQLQEQVNKGKNFNLETKVNKEFDGNFINMSMST